MNREETSWVPEILYEEIDEGLTSHIPFIQVPDEEDMPSMLFIFESRETGEFEPGPEGEELPVTQIDLHQYADMAILKRELTLQQYNTVRFALGLEPIKVAAEKGRKITANIRSAIPSEFRFEIIKDDD